MTCRALDGVLSPRFVAIVPLFPVLFAWTLALAVAGVRAETAERPHHASVAASPSAEPHFAEGDEPLALIAATALATPTPTPTPTPAPVVRAQPVARVSAADRERYAALIEDAAREFGQDPAFLVRVARCESGLNPFAVGGHGELGILQFKPPTFERNAARLGYTIGDIWDVRAQARVAAEMFSRQQQWQWTCAKKVASP